MDAISGLYAMWCAKVKNTTQVMLIHVVIYSKPSHALNILHGRQRVILKFGSLITTDQTAPVAETVIVYSSHHHQHEILY